jgi:DNA-binding NarL/FixJ family response regulator
VVLDILMPIMNGLEVQSRLREVSPSSRVVVLTSKDDPSVRSTAMDKGASAFFPKPVDDDAFLAGIESAARDSVIVRPKSNTRTCIGDVDFRFTS